MGRARVRLFGYPFHPTVVVFPLALFPASFLADVAFLATGDAFWWAAAFWAVGLGLLGAAVSLVTGLADFGRAVPSEGHATAVRHGLLGAALTALYAVVFILHAGDAAGAPVVPAVVLNGFGQLLVAGQGVLGGRLVYGHRAGVEPSSPTDADNGDAEKAE